MCFVMLLCQLMCRNVKPVRYQSIAREYMFNYYQNILCLTQISLFVFIRYHFPVKQWVPLSRGRDEPITIECDKVDKGKTEAIRSKY